MQRHRLTRYLALVGMCFTAPTLLRAQAFGLNEIGSCAFARGFAATSNPCKDASVIFWNPAAAASLKGGSAYGGVAAISIKAEFERDSSLGEHDADVPVQWVPHVFANYTMGRYAFGLGVYVPYGLTSQWKDDFPGRFLAKKAAVATLYIQPNFAMSFRNGDWMVGGGPVIGRSTVELQQGVDLADQVATTTPSTIRFRQLGIARRTEFARATLKGDAMAYGLNLGVFGKINENWTMGARYLSALIFKYDAADASFEQRPTGIVFAGGNPLGYPAGTQFDTLQAVRARFCGATGEAMTNEHGNPKASSTATCTAPGLLGKQKVSTRLPHPDQFQIGFARHNFYNWSIAVDYEWTGWRKLRELPIDFDSTALDKTYEQYGLDTLNNSPPILQDYNNTSALRIGAERMMPNGWALRLGVSGVAAAAPDETVTPLLPEQDRTYFSIGTAIPMGSMFTLDATYGFVNGAGRRGRIDERTRRSQLASALNSGVYNLHAHVFSASLKANF